MALFRHSMRENPTSAGVREGAQHAAGGQIARSSMRFGQRVFAIAAACALAVCLGFAGTAIADTADGVGGDAPSTNDGWEIGNCAEFKEAMANTSAGITYKLVSDIDFTAPEGIAYAPGSEYGFVVHDLQLDLNGHNITYDCAKSRLFQISGIFDLKGSGIIDGKWQGPLANGTYGCISDRKDIGPIESADIGDGVVFKNICGYNTKGFWDENWWCVVGLNYCNCATVHIGATFENCKGHRASALRVFDCDLTFTGKIIGDGNGLSEDGKTSCGPAIELWRGWMEADDAQFTNCYGADCGAINVIDGTLFVQGCEFTNCKAFNGAGAVRVYSTGEHEKNDRMVAVDNSSFRGCTGKTAAIAQLDSNTSVDVLNSTMNAVSSGALLEGAAEAEGNDSEGNDSEGNDSEACGPAFIVKGTSSVDIAMDIDGAGKNGSRMLGGGIDATGHTVNFKGNISNCTGDGATVKTSVGDATFSGNISNCGGHGIGISSEAAVTFSGNVSGCGGYGADFSAKKNISSTGSITDCGGYGAHVSTPGNITFKGDVKKCTGYGADISGNGIEFRGNIANCGGYGAHANAQGDLTLISDITDCGGYGVDITAQSVDFVGDIENCTGNGAKVNAQQGVKFNSETMHNTGNGVYIKTQGELVASGKIEDCQGYGMDVTAASVEYIGSIKNCSGYGASIKAQQNVKFNSDVAGSSDNPLVNGVNIVTEGAVTVSGSISNCIDGIDVNAPSVQVSGSVKNCKHKEHDGGAIYVHRDALSKTDLTLSNLKISDCEGKNGGAVCFDGGASGVLKLTDVDISGCHAWDCGTICVLSGASATMLRGSITGNVVNGSGGALFVTEPAGDTTTTVDFQNVTIKENLNSIGTGIVDLPDKSVATFTGCTVHRNRNSIMDYGTFAVRSGGNLTLKNCDVIGNADERPGSGTCVCTEAGSTLTISGGKMVAGTKETQKAVDKGACLFIQGKATIDGVDLEGFHARLGGVLCAGEKSDIVIGKNAPVTMHDGSSAIATSQGTAKGGCIYSESPHLELHKVTITDCRSYHNGGGIYVASGNTTLDNVSIGNCSAGDPDAGVEGFGGGLYVAGGTVTAANCTFTGNAATEAGGALFAAGGTTELTGFTATGNSAPNGGVMCYSPSLGNVNLAFDGFAGIQGAGAEAIDKTTDFYFDYRAAIDTRISASAPGSISVTVSDSGSSAQEKRVCTIGYDQKSLGSERILFKNGVPALSGTLLGLAQNGLLFSKGSDLYVAAGGSGATSDMCQVGCLFYPTLEEALQVVKPGETIRIFCDHAFDKPLLLAGVGTAQKPVVFDLNGYSLGTKTASNTLVIGDGAHVRLVDGIGSGKVVNETGADCDTVLVDGQDGELILGKGSRIENAVGVSVKVLNGTLLQEDDSLVKADSYGVTVLVVGEAARYSVDGSEATVFGAIQAEAGAQVAIEDVGYVHGVRLSGEASLTMSGGRIYDKLAPEDDSKHSIAADFGATVSIKGGTVDGGILVNGSAGASTAGSDADTVSLSISGGTVGTQGQTDCALDLAQCTVKMSGGTVYGNNPVKVDSSSSITVSGGTIEAVGCGIFGTIANGNPSGTVTISGGIVKAAGDAVIRDAVVKVTDGTLLSGDPYDNWRNCVVSSSVSGGRFVYQVADAEVADGYACIPWKDAERGTNCLVRESKEICQIGDVRYQTLMQAFAAVQPGDTVKMLENYALEGPLALANTGTADAPVVLDLNGKTLTEQTANDTITIGGGAFLTIKDSYTGLQKGGIVNQAETGAVIAVDGKAVVTIENITISSGTSGADKVGLRISKGDVRMISGAITLGMQNAYGVLMSDGASFQMDSGTIAPTGVASGIVAQGIECGNGCKLVLSGGKVRGVSMGQNCQLTMTDGRIDSSLRENGDALSMGTGSEAHISGGTVEATGVAVKGVGGGQSLCVVDVADGTVKASGAAAFENAVVSIAGGAVVTGGSSVNFKDCAVDHSVSGGRFVCEVIEGELSEGSLCMAFEDSELGTHYVVCPPQTVCLVNGAGFQTLKEGFAAARPSDVVLLLDDIALGETLSLEGIGTQAAPVVLDFNGHTVSGTIEGSALHLGGGSFLTLFDRTQDKAGGVANLSEAGTAISVEGASRISIQYGSVSGGNAVKLDATSSLAMSGGSIKAAAIGVVGAASDGVPASNAEITGGTVEASGAAAFEDAVVSITDGAVVTGGSSVNFKNCTVDHSVSGGVFSAKVTSDEVADGYACVVDEGDAQCPFRVVDVSGCAAQNIDTEEYYYGLQEAFDSVTAGQTIKLLNNINDEDHIFTLSECCGEDNSVTLDLNGCTIEATRGETDVFHRKQYSRFCVIDIEGDASLTVTDGSEEKTGAICNNSDRLACAIYIGHGSFTLLGGSVKCNPAASKAFPFYGEKTSIAGGRVVASERSGLAYEGAVTVSGGSFSCEVKGENLAPGARRFFDEADAECPYRVITITAEDRVINTSSLKGYTDLQEAFDEAAEGQRLELLDDIPDAGQTFTLSGAGAASNPVTLDLAGYTVQGSAASIIGLDGSALKVADSSASGTGAIRNTAADAGGSAVFLGSGSSLALESGSVECAAGYAVAGESDAEVAPTVAVSGGRVAGAGGANWESCVVDHSISGGAFSYPVVIGELADGLVCACDASDSACPYFVREPLPGDVVQNATTGVFYGNPQTALDCASAGETIRLSVDYYDMVDTLSLVGVGTQEAPVTFAIDGILSNSSVSPTIIVGDGSHVVLSTTQGYGEVCNEIKGGTPILVDGEDCNLVIGEASETFEINGDGQDAGAAITIQNGSVTQKTGKILSNNPVAVQVTGGASRFSVDGANVGILGDIQADGGAQVVLEQFVSMGKMSLSNGAILTLGVGRMSAIQADSGSTVQIAGGEVEGGIVVNGGSANPTAGSDADRVKLDVSGGAIGTQNEAGCALDLAQCDATVSGGTVYGADAVKLDAASSFTMSDGSIQATGVAISGEAASGKPGGSVGISGGTVESTGAEAFRDAVVGISGGTIVAAESSGIFGNCTADHSVSGGRFSHELASDAVAEGCLCEKDGADEKCPYLVRALRDDEGVLNVATGKQYLTLQEAFDKVAAGQELKVLADLPNVYDIALRDKGTEPVILDLCGHTVSGKIGGIEGVPFSLVSIVGVKGSSLTVKDSSEDGTGAICNNNGVDVRVCAVSLGADSSFVLDSGSIVCPHGYAIASDSDAASAPTVAVSGGRVVAGGSANWTNCTVDHSISGGRFTCAVTADEMADGFECIQDGSDPQCPYSVQRWVPADGVLNADTGEVFSNLQDAFDNVLAGQTLVLFEDDLEVKNAFTLSGLGRDADPVTLDLNGHVLSNAGTEGEPTKNDIIKVDDSVLTIADSSPAGTGAVRQCAAYYNCIQLSNGSTLDLRGGCIEGTQNNDPILGAGPVTNRIAVSGGSIIGSSNWFNCSANRTVTGGRFANRVASDALANGYVCIEDVQGACNYLVKKDPSSWPDDPDNPDSPDNPDNPENPDNPDQPEQPDNPDQPDQPEQPNNPDQPDNPDDSDNPENPDNPDQPEQPDNPENPDQPGQSDALSEDNPAVQAETAGSAAETGGNTAPIACAAAVAVAAIVVAAIALALSRRRRQ